MNRSELLKKIKKEYGSVDKFSRTLFLHRSCVYRHISGYAFYHRVNNALLKHGWIRKTTRIDKRYKLQDCTIVL